jgi:hypothetical protein
LAPRLFFIHPSNPPSLPPIPVRCQ